MSLAVAFGSLLRALTGGRFGGSQPEASPAFGPEWNQRPVQLGLPATAFHDLVTRDSLHPHFHYRRFTRSKANGGCRAIAEPDPRLKRIQHDIIARYFEPEQPHWAAVAYRRKKSVADHVWPHAGAEIIIAADVADFFPATRRDRVEEWWRGRVDDRLARLLTVLTTDRGGLPQGAPTSPGLSNFVNVDLDERLAQWAAAAGAAYTRYSDDLLFSWRAGSGPPAAFEAGVRAAVGEVGYHLHPHKGWRVYERNDEPEVTGVILARHGGVRLPERMLRTMQELARSRDPRDTERLLGYLGYQTMVGRPVKRVSRPKGRKT